MGLGAELTNELLPAKYTDGESREWQLRLDYVKLAKIRTELKIDLGNVEQMGRTWAEILLGRPQRLDVIWIAMDGARGGRVRVRKTTGSPQWTAAGSSRRGALEGAIGNFTPPLKRTILRQGMEGVDKTYRQAIEEARERMSQQMNGAIKKAIGVHGVGCPRRVCRRPRLVRRPMEPPRSAQSGRRQATRRLRPARLGPGVDRQPHAQLRQASPRTGNAAPTQSDAAARLPPAERPG